MTPRVSVVVPTRDRRPALARTLAAVVTQTFRDFELIVVDDGSVDGTPAWVREKHPDARLIVRATSAGAAAGRNLGIEHARGELVALLDDDDVWRPSYLEAQVRALDAHPDAPLSYTGHVEVDAGGHVSWPDTRTLLPDASALVRLLADCPIHTSSVVVCRRQAFERFGSFDETLSVVHDYEWYARVVSSGTLLHHEDEPLVERGLPGGIVRQHRTWYREEARVVEGMLDDRAAERRIVRTYRALFFARLALSRGDVTFGLARLAEASRRSPRLAARLTAAAIGRRRLRPPAAAGAGA